MLACVCERQKDEDAMMRLYIVILIALSSVLLSDGFSASVASSSPNNLLNKVEDDNKWKWRGHDIYTEAHTADSDGEHKPTCILL